MKAPKTIKRLWSSNLSGGQIGYIFSRCLRDTMRPLSVCPMLDERAGVFLSRLAQNSKKKDTYQFFFALKCLTDGLQTDNVEEKILLYLSLIHI